MEEEPSGPSPDMPAAAEPSFTETDKEVLSPAVAAAATSSSMGEETGPERAATPPVWDRGGPGGTQQGGPSPPDSGQPGPGSSLGPASTVSGTSEDLRPPRRRQQPGKQIPCSSPGCCLSFPSVRDLAQHLRTHCPPTQSLEGKLFRCSALSCTETFPSMQELVAHGKLHYKPNRYFKCENCLLRFRTHRSLFKHLHVCAEHAQSPAPPPPPRPRQGAAGARASPGVRRRVGAGPAVPAARAVHDPRPCPHRALPALLEPRALWPESPTPAPLPGRGARAARLQRRSLEEEPRCRRQPAKTPGRLRHALRDRSGGFGEAQFSAPDYRREHAREHLDQPGQTSQGTRPRAASCGSTRAAATRACSAPSPRPRGPP
uniref:Zinc finger protein 414 n=1 Tax=Canis lupus familiaris TaxID=9615 RepID=A0A8I3N3W0_CANLF